MTHLWTTCLYPTHERNSEVLWYALEVLRVPRKTNYRSTFDSFVSDLSRLRTFWRNQNRSTWRYACFPKAHFRILCPCVICRSGEDNRQHRISVCSEYEEPTFKLILSLIIVLVYYHKLIAYLEWIYI